MLRRAVYAAKVDSDVIVVGSGPAGVLCATMLSTFGLRVAIFEKNKNLSDHPKAHFMNFRTMEILRPFCESVAEIKKRMEPLEQWRKFIYCEDLTSGKEFGVVDHFPKFHSSPFQLKISPEPVVHLSQNRLLQILVEQMRRNAKVEMMFGHEVDRCTSNSKGVTVWSKKSEKAYHGHYAIIANGANSQFLQQLQIPVHGTGVLQNLLSVHFRSKQLAEHVRANPAMLYFVLNLKTVLVIIMHNLQKGEFVAQIPFFPPLQEINDFDTDVCKESIQHAAGCYLDDLTIHSIDPWRMKSEVAETFQRGRIFFIGDAAHVFPPAGGFGMNSSIHDAHNLAWKLAAVMKGKAPESLLETYSEERHPVIQRIADISVQNWREASKIPKAIGLDPENAILLNKWISGSLSNLLPLPVAKNLLQTSLSLGRQLSGYRGLFASWRKQQVEQILKKGASLKLQFLNEDLGFVYQSMEHKTKDPTSETKNRDTPFIESFQIGGRFPHCLFQLKRNGKLISSLDVITWSGLRYCLFYHDSNSHCLDDLRRSKLATSLLFVAVCPPRDDKKESWDGYVEYCAMDWEEEALEVYDLQGKWMRLSQAMKKDIIVVRPDGHILALGNSHTLLKLMATLKSVTKLT